MCRFCVNCGVLRRRGPADIRWPAERPRANGRVLPCRAVRVVVAPRPRLLIGRPQARRCVRVRCVAPFSGRPIAPAGQHRATVRQAASGQRPEARVGAERRVADAPVTWPQPRRSALPPRDAREARLRQPCLPETSRLSNRITSGVVAGAVGDHTLCRQLSRADWTPDSLPALSTSRLELYADSALRPSCCAERARTVK
jgi:hypothetical protein